MDPAGKTFWGSWPTTNWSMVGRAGQSPGIDQREALVALLMRYLPVLRSHLLKRGLARRDEVDDLLQQFLVSKVIEQEIIAKASKGRGKFRSFLTAALDRFALNAARDQKALKRSPDRTIGLDAAPEPIYDSPSPTNHFDLHWARQVIGQTIRRMRAKCHRDQRPDIWGVFNGRVLGPCLRGVAETPYSELLQTYNFESPGKATNILVTGTRMFAHVLRSVISTYASDEDDIEQEIRDLWNALADSGARSRRF